MVLQVMKWGYNLTHHTHTHPTVYQDFSSSGMLNAKCIDSFLNKLWDLAFYKAIKTNCFPQTIIEPYVRLIEKFIIIGIPVFLCMIHI
jgi:hypothetical protein